MQKPIAENIKKAHDRIAGSYGLSHVSEDAPPNSYSRWNLDHNVITPLKKICASYWSDAHVLDAGCGNGQITEILLSCGTRHVTGVDFSLNMLKNARQRLKRQKMLDRFWAVQADLGAMKMINACIFDGAILFGVVEHLDDPAIVIDQIWQKLREGGVFAVAIPRKRSLSHLTYLIFGESPKRWGSATHWWDRFRFIEKSRYYKFYSPKAAEQLLLNKNMEIVEKLPFAYSHMDGLPGMLLRLLGRYPGMGHTALNLIDKICSGIRCIPAGEFWIIRKNAHGSVDGKSPGYLGVS